MENFLTFIFCHIGGIDSTLPNKVWIIFDNYGQSQINFDLYYPKLSIALAIPSEGLRRLSENKHPPYYSHQYQYSFMILSISFPPCVFKRVKH